MGILNELTYGIHSIYWFSGISAFRLLLSQKFPNFVCFLWPTPKALNQPRNAIHLSLAFPAFTHPPSLPDQKKEAPHIPQHTHTQRINHSMAVVVVATMLFCFDKIHCCFASVSCSSAAEFRPTTSNSSRVATTLDTYYFPTTTWATVGQQREACGGTVVVVPLRANRDSIQQERMKCANVFGRLWVCVCDCNNAIWIICLLMGMYLVHVGLMDSIGIYSHN